MLYALIPFILFAQPTDPPSKSLHDYTADIRALAPAPAPDSAWPLYLRAYTAFECVPDVVHNLLPTPPGDDWPQTREYLRAHAPALALLREATACRNMGYPIATTFDPAHIAANPCPASHEPEDPPPPGTPRVRDLRLGYASQARLYTRLLYADTLLALEDKDGERTAANLSALLGLTRHCAAYPDPATDQTSIAIVIVTLDLLKDILATKPTLLPDGALATLNESLATTPIAIHKRPRTLFRRYELLDHLQRAFTDDGKGSGHLTPEGVRYFNEIAGEDKPRAAKDVSRAYGWLTGSAGRDAILKEFDRIAHPDYWHQPLWTLSEWPDYLRESTRDEFWHVKYKVLYYVLPDTGRLARISEHALQRIDGTRTALALEQHFRRVGSFPDQLERLNLPGGLPVDRFTGEPLLYHATATECTLYSRGLDLDDDHAAESKPSADFEQWIPPKAPRDPDNPPPDGDWVLFRIKH